MWEGGQESCAHTRVYVLVIPYLGAVLFGTEQHGVFHTSSRLACDAVPEALPFRVGALPSFKSPDLPLIRDDLMRQKEPLFGAIAEPSPLHLAPGT